MNCPMQKFGYLIFLITFLFSGLILSAQKRKDTTVVVRDDYKVKIANPQKYLEVPEISDTVREKLNIRYDLNSRKVPTAYEIDPIKAANIKNESISQLQRGFLKAGYGSYLTPYGEIYYNQGRSKKFGAGAHFKHLSSSGQIAKRGYAGFSNNDMDLNGKYFLKKATLSGNIDYKHHLLHYYGFDPAKESLPEYQKTDLTKNGTRQFYQLFRLNSTIGDNYPVDSQATKFNAEMDYYHFSDRAKATENAFLIRGNSSFYYKTYAFSASGYLNYFGNTNQSDTGSMTILNLFPGITFNKNLWRLKAGLNTYISSDEDNSFRVVPELDFNFHIYKDIIILNAGTDSRLKRNSWRMMIQENPFLRSDVAASNTWAPMRLYSGLRGALGSRMAFNLRASYGKIDNQYFFVNDTTSGNFNKMNVVFDNVSLTEINGELSWQQNKKIEIIAKANYLGYKMDKEQKPWHVPALRLSLSGKYNIQDKITVTPVILYLSNQFSKEISTSTDTSTGKKSFSVQSNRINGITDVNIAIDYKYTQRLGMFLYLNNILNVRYERFRDYPTQRFNLLAGVFYSF